MGRMWECVCVCVFKCRPVVKVARRIHIFALRLQHLVKHRGVCVHVHACVCAFMQVCVCVFMLLCMTVCVCVCVWLCARESVCDLLNKSAVTWVFF